MKNTLFIISLGLLSGSVVADDCTARLNAHIAGKTMGIAATEDMKTADIERQKLADIEAMRQSKSDCEIAEQIPGLRSAQTPQKTK